MSVSVSKCRCQNVDVCVSSHNTQLNFSICHHYGIRKGQIWHHQCMLKCYYYSWLGKQSWRGGEVWVSTIATAIKLRKFLMFNSVLVKRKLVIVNLASYPARKEGLGLSSFNSLARTRPMKNGQTIDYVPLYRVRNQYPATRHIRPPIQTDRRGLAKRSLHHCKVLS